MLNTAEFESKTVGSFQMADALLDFTGCKEWQGEKVPN